MSHDYDIGFLGGGQLARMSIQAAQRMGLRCLVLDPAENAPACQLAGHVDGPLDDVASIARIASACERVTLENEFIPADAIEAGFAMADRSLSALCPNLDALRLIQDKLAQRRHLDARGIAGPGYSAFEGEAGTDPHGFDLPIILKARFGGYDGKGTRLISGPDELDAARGVWLAGGWYAEDFVRFAREVAVMVAVDRSGAAIAFPTMETIQTDHVCDLVFQAGVDASDLAIRTALSFESPGLFGIEMFELPDGSFAVNEVAPRPHNTGHYTLDWGGVSQFEQHVRVVMELPLIQPVGDDACMANLLGQPGATDFRKGLRAALEGDPGVRVHWYGKADSKPGRKMGHLNAIGTDCVARAKAARNRFYRAWTA